MSDHYMEVPLYVGGTTTAGQVHLGVQDGDTVKYLIHSADIAEAGVKSLHLPDDSTAYQNTSGFDAQVIILIRGRDTGTQARHIKVYSAPTTDSTSSATEVFDYDGTNFNASTSLLTTPPLKISNNHYIVIENVDESRVGNNDVDVGLFGTIVVERQV